MTFELFVVFVLGILVGSALGALTFYMGVVVTEKIFNKMHPNGL